MELAFWDPMTMGPDPGASLPVGADLVGDTAMGKVGSMGFEEMLQWMQTDIGKDLDAAPKAPSNLGPAPLKETFSNRIPSFDLTGFLGDFQGESQPGNNGVAGSAGFMPQQQFAAPPPFAPQQQQQQQPSQMLPPFPRSQQQPNASSHYPEISQRSANQPLSPQDSMDSITGTGASQNAFQQNSLVSPFAPINLQQQQPMQQQVPQVPQQQVQQSVQQQVPQMPQQQQQQVQLPGLASSQQTLMSIKAMAAAQTRQRPGSIAMSPMEVLQQQQELELKMLQEQQRLQQKQLEEFLATQPAGFAPPAPAFQPPQHFQFQQALLQQPPQQQQQQQPVPPVPAVAGGVGGGVPRIEKAALPMKTSPTASQDSDKTATLKELEQKVIAEMEHPEQPKQDIINVKMTEIGLSQLTDQPPSSLYSQMLRSKAQRGGPIQRARTSARDRMNDLERQVGELQQEKATLTEETNNMQCRLNILDRMLQLRRENCEEVTDENIRLDDSIQVAALVAETEAMTTKETAHKEEQPKVKTLAKIFEREYSIETFDEMSSTWKDATSRMTEVMAELDKLPMGTDLSSTPLVAKLEEEIKIIQSICSGYNTRGGGNLMLQWNQHVLKNATSVNKTFTKEFSLNYQRIYPLLRLTPVQKERIQLTYAIYEQRYTEMTSERSEHEAAFKKGKSSSRGGSMVDSCRSGTACLGRPCSPQAALALPGPSLLCILPVLGLLPPPPASPDIASS